jgi:hypothetical protein
MSIVALMLVIPVAFVFAACGKKSNDNGGGGGGGGGNNAGLDDLKDLGVTIPAAPAAKSNYAAVKAFLDAGNYNPWDNFSSISIDKQGDEEQIHIEKRNATQYFSFNKSAGEHASINGNLNVLGGTTLTSYNYFQYGDTPEKSKYIDESYDAENGYAMGHAFDDFDMTVIPATEADFKAMLAEEMLPPNVTPALAYYIEGSVVTIVVTAKGTVETPAGNASIEMAMSIQYTFDNATAKNLTKINMAMSQTMKQGANTMKQTMSNIVENSSGDIIASLPTEFAGYTTWAIQG